MFQGKNVLVTGSARNTGWGIAKVFGDYGATVFVHGRSIEQVEKAAERLGRQPGSRGGGYVPVAADVACEEDVQRALAFIEQPAGGLDVLVNNACHLGLGYGFLDMPIAFFDEVLAVNLRGYALCAQHAARQMIARGGGAIVNIGSNTAGRVISNRAAYIASKGGVESLTRAIAVELAQHNIRVNCVIPGYIRTERWNDLCEAAAAGKRPLGRESTAELGEAQRFSPQAKHHQLIAIVSGGIDISWSRRTALSEGRDGTREGRVILARAGYVPSAIRATAHL